MGVLKKNLERFENNPKTEGTLLLTVMGVPIYCQIKNLRHCFSDQQIPFPKIKSMCLGNDIVVITKQQHQMLVQTVSHTL